MKRPNTASSLKTFTKKEKLQKELQKVEKKLEKCRTTVQEDGWQTQRHARKSVDWDYYAKKKMQLIQQIDDL